MTWETIASVESDSRPGVTYSIKQAPNGRIGCTCPAYRFKKGEKTCKHIRVWNGDVDVTETPQSQAEPGTLIVATPDET